MKTGKKPECEECPNPAKFECDMCGTQFCIEHAEGYDYECPYCVPRLVPIKKVKREVENE